MRRIYEYMSKKEKVRALGLLRVDIIELEKELHNDYSRVVTDAITETLNRYQAEEEWLKNEVEAILDC
jgi:post-segregation antitoxin (ccd killing protein)